MKQALPVLLLLICGQRGYLVRLLPEAWEGDVWNVCGAVAVTALVWMTVAAWPSRLARLVAIWATGEEILVAGCSAWWIADPWIVQPGEDQCDRRLGFKFGAVGVAAMAYLLLRVCTDVRSDSSSDSGGVTK